MTQETIFALATAPGKSGVAIIRISGAQALSALIQLTGKSDWQPNLVHHTSFSRTTNHESRTTIDTGLAIFFKSPKSFTGEDVAELHIHGSLAVIREMLETLSGIQGLRPAEAGEFTRRAFINGKMDLIEAEGLADLIDAVTHGQKTQAMRQMEGELSRYYEDLRRRIVQTLAHLEAYIDFPEEDIPESVIHSLSNDIGSIKKLIEDALADHARGERIREGIRVVIIGAPNAGKSSLLNALAKRDAAIVSHTAGTTRDIIDVHMDIAGLPVILTDTAGLRESADEIEEEGIRRAIARAGEADLKLALFDGSLLPEIDSNIIRLLDNQTICVITKSDIMNSHIVTINNYNTYKISTKTGDGIELLLSEIQHKITCNFSGEASPLITRNRHRSLLTNALYHLNQIDFSAPLEIICEELRLAAHPVGKITGKIAVDDVLDVIFKQFCIGK